MTSSKEVPRLHFKLWLIISCLKQQEATFGFSLQSPTLQALPRYVGRLQRPRVRDNVQGQRIEWNIRHHRLCLLLKHHRKLGASEGTINQEIERYQQLESVAVNDIRRDVRKKLRRSSMRVRVHEKYSTGLLACM